MDKKYLVKGEKSKWEDLFLDLVKEMEVMPSSIKDKVYRNIGWLLNEQLKLIRDCQTPIEFLLAEEINEQIERFISDNDFHHEVCPQETIWIDSKTKYRVDLLVRSLPIFGNGKHPEIIIECDGHEFHEKTKEQAQADKQRDRNLQLAGFYILRFTGSEIVANPSRCAKDVIQLLKKLIYEG